MFSSLVIFNVKRPLEYCFTKMSRIFVYNPLAHKKKKSIQFTRVMYFAIKYLSNLRHYVTFPPLYLN